MELDGSGEIASEGADGQADRQDLGGLAEETKPRPACCSAERHGHLYAKRSSRASPPLRGLVIQTGTFGKAAARGSSNVSMNRLKCPDKFVLHMQHELVRESSRFERAPNQGLEPSWG